MDTGWSGTDFFEVEDNAFIPSFSVSSAWQNMLSHFRNRTCLSQMLGHLCCVSLWSFLGIDRSPIESTLCSLCSFRSAMSTVGCWCCIVYQDECPAKTSRDENVCKYSVSIAKRERQDQGWVPGPKSQRRNRLSKDVLCKFQSCAPDGGQEQSWEEALWVINRHSKNPIVLPEMPPEVWQLPSAKMASFWGPANSWFHDLKKDETYHVPWSRWKSAWENWPSENPRLATSPDPHFSKQSRKKIRTSALGLSSPGGFCFSHSGHCRPLDFQCQPVWKDTLWVTYSFFLWWKTQTLCNWANPIIITLW